MSWMLVEVEGGEVTKTLNDMLHQLEDTPQEMAQEMTAWQTDDMHRTFPYTVLHSFKHVATVRTVIWPRGESKENRAQEHAMHVADRIAQRQADKVSQFLFEAAGPGAKRSRFRRRRKASYVIHITRRTYQRARHRPVLRESLFDMLVTRMTGLLEAIHWQ